MALLTHYEPDILTKLQKPTTIDLVGGILCHICQLTLANKKDYDAHYTSHPHANNKIIYSCVVCYKQIAGYPSFRGHCYTSHVIKHRYKCEYCLKLFSKEYSLKEHIGVMHTFKCTTCKKEFTTKKELQLHRIIHNETDTPPYNCNACKDKIDSVDGCHEHVEMHSMFIYTCPICNENIPNISSSAEHLKKHFTDVDVTNQRISEKQESSIEKQGGIYCLFCARAYKNRVEFDAHFSCDHGDEDIIYTCVSCFKQFEKYSVFSSHVYNHVSKNRFECNICYKAFPRISLLVSHMSMCEMDSGSTGKPFVCMKCSHRYATEGRLREHLREAHNMSQLKCQEEGCDKMFKTITDLLFHQRCHKTQKLWCSQCGYSFSSLQSCQRHLDVHRKKLYVCPVCNRNYSEKYLIEKHVHQHFETVLHMCKVCGKVYNAKNRLMEHIKSHSQTKVHTCQYCEKSFTKLSHLQQHLNIHTGARPFKCSMCPKTFSSYPNWTKHLRRMHNKVEKYKNVTDISKEMNIDSNIVENNNCKEIGDSKSTSGTDDTPLMEICDDLADFETVDLPKDPTEVYEKDNPSLLLESIDHTVIENELKRFEKGENIENLNETALDSIINECAQGLAADIPQTSETVGYPPEYGPEFNNGLETGCGFLDLDDHNLPHIDPLLTLKIEEHFAESPHFLENFTPNIEYDVYDRTKTWEPPIITKVEQQLYGYNATETNKLIMLSNDNFEVFT